MVSRFCYELWDGFLFSSISGRRKWTQPWWKVWQTSPSVDRCAKAAAFHSHVTKPNQHSLVISKYTFCFLRNKQINKESMENRPMECSIRHAVIDMQSCNVHKLPRRSTRQWWSVISLVRARRLLNCAPHVKSAASISLRSVFVTWLKHNLTFSFSPLHSQAHFFKTSISAGDGALQTNSCLHELYPFSYTVFKWKTSRRRNKDSCRKTKGREAETGLAREKVRSHAEGMLQGGIAGVTAPFFTAIIRTSCQWEGP